MRPQFPKVHCVYFEFIFGHTKDCTIFIEDSILSDLSAPVHIAFEGVNYTSDSVQVILSNVTLTNSSTGTPVVSLLEVAILFVNCTFEHNAGSVIQAIDSKVIFQGNNTFKNNYAPIGGGIQLLNSYM